jgi:hypothetical protein
VVKEDSDECCCKEEINRELANEAFPDGETIDARCSGLEKMEKHTTNRMKNF